MDEVFKIYIDRLFEGKRELIRESIPPDFMDIHESDLVFFKPIEISGEAYLADDTLILHLGVTAFALIPCAICNRETEVVIQIPSFYHAEELKQIPGGIFDFSAILRESILLEVPTVLECNNGSCPERLSLANYLNQNKDKGMEYHPFKDL